MSKERGIGPAPAREINEGLIDFLSGVARFLLWGSALALLVGVAFLIYTLSVFSAGSAAADKAQALSNISIYDKFVLAGVLGIGASTSYLFWGESILAAIQLMGGALLFFSPFIFTMAGLTSAEKGDVA